ncbi:MAG: dihydroorotase [Bacteroidia bacterium]
MMDILIRNCKVSDPLSANNGNVCDILIKDGRIAEIQIGKIDESEIKVIDAEGFEIMPGVFDFQVNCGEPGEEVKETFSSLSQSGLFGGVTGMLVMPSHKPSTDNRGQLEFKKRKTENLALDFQFAGNISIEGKGKNLAEMYDMFLGGAIAFSDNKAPADNALLIHLAIQYSKVSGGSLIFHADESGLRMGGNVHEGEVSVQLGMKGHPAMAEEISVAKLIAIAEYNKVNIHIAGISSAGSVNLISEAKRKGIALTCSAFIPNLYFTDDDLTNFDSIYKVWPPLRSKADRAALKNGIKSGVIDVISSDHSPETIEFKDVEFDYAAYGMSGTQTLLQAALTVMNDMATEDLVNVLCHNPRKLLSLEPKTINKGELADFALIDRGTNQLIEKSMLHSLSVNNAFVGKSLQGKILGTYTNSQWFSRY